MRRGAWMLGLWVVVPLVCLPLACSGGDELFGGGTVTSAVSASSAAVSGTGGSTSNVSAQSSAESSASTGGAGPGPMSSAEASSTSSGVMVEIPCTNQTCTTGMVCCVHATSPSLDQCQSPGACDMQYTEVACNGPNDCLPGESCCGAFNGSGYDIVACGNNCISYTMCGDEPSICAALGAQCFQSSYLPQNHGYCG